MKEKEYLLNAGGVDEISEELQEVLTEQGMERREALRIRLTIEELLLRVMEHNHDAPVTATLSVRKRFGARTLFLKYGGPSFDPSDVEDGTWGSRILQNIGLDPTWSWRRGENCIQLQISARKPMSQLASILLAIVLAAALGAMGRFIPADTATALTDLLLTPIFEAFLGLLTTFAGLMIFLTVSSGVFGIGDTGSLNRVGRTMFPHFLGGVFIVSAASVFLLRPFLSLQSQGGGEGSSQLKEISEMLFNILPKNLVQPFLEGNAMQIVVLAVFTGIVLLLLGEQTRRVSRFGSKPHARALLRSCRSLT